MLLADIIGTRMTLWIGRALPRFAPAKVMNALESVEVAISEVERSGFSLSFRVDRPASILGDAEVAANPDLSAGSRVVIMMTLGATAHVLMDGIIEETEFTPAEGETPAKHVARGKDLLFLLEREEREIPHPAQGPGDIARTVLLPYAAFGMVPLVIDPPVVERPNPVERTPMQRGTDFDYLTGLAEQYDQVFTLTPGPAPLTSQVYWGPPPRAGAPQRAISTDLGSETNVGNLSFENLQSEASDVEGTVQDSDTDQATPVRSIAPLRPPLAAKPSLADPATAKTKRLEAQGAPTAARAMAEAQAQSDATTDTLKVTGDLDTARYGGVLAPRRLVGLRGAGLAYDGFYHVQDVVHKIAPGSWTQSFTAVREGTGTTTPVVIP